MRNQLRIKLHFYDFVNKHNVRINYWNYSVGLIIVLSLQEDRQDGKHFATIKIHFTGYWLYKWKDAEHGTGVLDRTYYVCILCISTTHINEKQKKIYSVMYTVRCINWEEYVRTFYVVYGVSLLLCENSGKSIDVTSSSHWGYERRKKNQVIDGNSENNTELPALWMNECGDVSEITSFRANHFYV